MEDKTKRPTERGYGGVIYTPGSAARQNGPYKTQGAQRPATVTRKVGVKRKKKKQKSQFGVFLAATMFTGVVVCIIVFAVVVNSIMSGPGRNNQSPAARVQSPQETKEPELAVAIDKTDSITGLVKSIGTNGQLTVYDFNTGKNLNLIADSLSLLKSKYGESIVFAEISAGDIVDVEYSGNIIKELFFSRQAEEYKNISNVKIDTVSQTITIGNENFTYNDQLITYSKGDELDLSSIKPLDVVSVKFYKNVIWYFALNKGHGFIDFVKNEIITDGVVEIDNNIIRSLENFEKTEVLEGPHRLVVKGSNVQPISREIYIEKNATATIDLSEMELLSGLLILRVNEPGYSVKIDGNEIDLTQPIELKYGEYAVTVEKEGYHPWEGTAEIKNRSNELAVDLTEKIQFCKLTVTSIPEGAEIYIDNGFIGVTPCTANIEYGTHTLTYKKEGYRSINFDIIIDKPADSFPLLLQEEAPFMPY